MFEDFSKICQENAFLLIWREYDMIWYDMIWYDMIWYDMIWYMVYDMIYCVNWNWVVTRWQQYSTYLHTNNTQNDTKQTIHRTIQRLEECGPCPVLASYTLAFALQLRKKHGNLPGFFFRMSSVSDKSRRESHHTFYVPITFFENRAVYEIMWKNKVERDRPQMTV